MKLTCTQENLAHGLNIVSRIGDKNVNLPILNNVLMQARKDGLTLITTNLEIGIRTKIRGKIEQEGDFTVNAKLLTDFVNSLPKENVTLVLEEKNLHIQGENHQTTIRGMDAQEYPVIPDVESTTAFAVETARMKNALSQTLFSVSVDESRPELTGILLQLDSKTCILASTDSYRLAEKKIVLDAALKEGRNVIVPARSLGEVARVLDMESAERMSAVINDNQALFTVGDTAVVTRIITGEYPDYQQIVPKEFKNTVTFKITDMVRAVKTTSLFCKQGINDIRLSLDKRFSDIAINAENSTLGKNVSNVPSLTKNQEMDIVFNYKFFLDGLNHLDGDTAVLKVNDAQSPALLTSQTEGEYLYVIMPIRQ